VRYACYVMCVVALLASFLLYDATEAEAQGGATTCTYTGNPFYRHVNCGVFDNTMRVSATFTFPGELPANDTTELKDIVGLTYELADGVNTWTDLANLCTAELTTVGGSVTTWRVYASDPNPTVVGQSSSGTGTDFIFSWDSGWRFTTVDSIPNPCVTWYDDKCVAPAGNNENAELPGSWNCSWDPPTTPPTATTAAAAEATSSGATLNGDITDTGGENCDQRGFRYRKTGLSTWTDWAETGSFATGTYNHSVTSLSSGTAYEYQASAHNSAGWGYGSTQKFTTATSPPTAIAATEATATSFFCNWNASTGATSYRLDVSIKNDFSTYVTGYQNKDVGAVNTSAVIGLTAGTAYYYRVRSVNAAGTSGNSNIISTTTLTLPTKVHLSGLSIATAGAVSTAFTLTSQDAGGNPSNVPADTTFDLSSNSSGTKVFYSNAAGTAVITQTTIPNGTSSGTFYYKDSAKGTPTLTAAWRSGGTDLGSDTLPVTVNLAEATLAISSNVASSFKDFKVTVTRIEMNNGTTWVEIFSGASELDLVNLGTFPGISNVALPFGTYSRMKVTFRNSLPVTGTLTYGGTAYYTTTATFGGANNIAGDPANNAGSQTVFTFKIEEWGALNTDVTKDFSITPVTVDASTDYQPILRFTISKTFLFKGSAGTASTYYFALSAPTVSLIEP